MQEPITANYVPDGDDWQVTVTAGAQKRSAKASGLLAARDQVDQLADQLEPEQDARTVVHLLDGDAVAFTTNYLEARLGITAAVPEQPGQHAQPGETPEADADTARDMAPAAAASGEQSESN